MATQEIKDLLLEAGPFARLSAMEQRSRLVRYYQPWFAPGWKPDTVNNIRATQRLVTHAKAMAAPVGTVLMAILEEASGLGATQLSSRGLMDVEADTGQDEDTPADSTLMEVHLTECVPERVQELTPESAQEPTPEAMTDIHPLHAPTRPKSRSNRVK